MNGRHFSPKRVSRRINLRIAQQLNLLPGSCRIGATNEGNDVETIETTGASTVEEEGRPSPPPTRQRKEGRASTQSEKIFSFCSSTSLQKRPPTRPNQLQPVYRHLFHLPLGTSTNSIDFKTISTFCFVWIDQRRWYWNPQNQSATRQMNRLLQAQQHLLIHSSALMASIKGGASLRPLWKLIELRQARLLQLPVPIRLIWWLQCWLKASREKQKLAADSSDEDDESDDSRW